MTPYFKFFLREFERLFNQFTVALHFVSGCSVLADGVEQRVNGLPATKNKVQY